MCGIFGYSGSKDAAKEILTGLKRLEYRGYDSWGIAINVANEINVVKKIGFIGNLEDIKHLPKANIGIGHTRWATHGGVTEHNAHPHYSTDQSFIVAQNGIVENYQELKATLLKKGYEFKTETDTEVIVRLIEDELQKQPTKSAASKLKLAVKDAFLKLEGRNTIIVLSNKDNHILAIRNGSPLVVGIGKDEVYFASDALSFADKTNQVVFLNDFDMVEYSDKKVNLSNVKNGETIPVTVSKLNHEDVTIDKEGYQHFMLKEIVEQKHTMKEATNYSLPELQPLLSALKSARQIYTIGAGTAGFAAGQIAYFLRKYAQLPVIELKSYEIDSYKEIFASQDIIIAISQSGETADTIEALDIAKEKGVKIASIVNMIGSTISRMSDFAFLTRSGPEICVASTKAFTAQIAWGLLLALSYTGMHEEIRNEIKTLADDLAAYFKPELFEQIKALALKLKSKQHFFVLGKGQNYYIALEGALKIKEITYKHFEGFAAGELKHGVIALIDKGTPVIAIISKDDYQKDLLSAIAEVKARGASVVGISELPNSLFDEQIVPCESGKHTSPIANVIPLQLLSYFLGVELGNSPDRPRNLAKSVTVK